MKMPRSQCEAGNVQFVQELAEVDGPFEAPININFRDLIKLELPALVWNRSDACPRKMKITNTGHTVIVSAKWKCERPYLTGGPLVGKYVFSQIHFHWGQTDCRGSEHQICGEQFPLEMHVAHFKTEYMTQESALREKDGMVVVVYLFKLQEEPNHSLKRIINSLPRVKQPSTSFAIDPRPIVSLCHPFTEDYFMYWGSVVTSTCAHILLWIICREPFGISKEQVSEFRKIMDSSQQPICKNSREVQPLHKRNVFHVNASKHLDNPLLPIKKRLGCYCKQSKDDFDTSDSCHCQGAFQNQEDVEGNLRERADFEGMQTEHSCFANQTFVVQTATLSFALKRTGSDPVKKHRPLNNLKKVKSEIYNQQVKLVSKSCSFFPTLETRKINNLSEKRKVREKNKLFTSVKAFSQIMHSLETLKNQTFKKLKKIESINQEIKEMKPFCQDTEDKRWIRRIEKMVTKQKRFTIKSSQGCLSELKKLAKDCNFDRYFDSKALPTGANNRKMVWFTNNVIATAELPCYDNPIEEEETHEFENKPSKHSDVGKTIRFSSKAQNLIESFFEDIKDCEDFQETVTKDPNFKKIKSLCSLARNSNSISVKNMGYITQKMFNLGNLGDRFFTEITTEDMNVNENSKYEEQREELTTPHDLNETKNTIDCYESEKLTKINIENKSRNEDAVSLHKLHIPISPPNFKEENRNAETLVDPDASFKNENNETFLLKKTSKKIHLKKSVDSNGENSHEVIEEKPMRTNEAKVISSKSQSSCLNFSTDSTDIQTTKKVKKLKKGFSEQKRKSTAIFKISSKKLHSKTSFKKFESFNMQKKNLKNKEKKKYKAENAKNKHLSSTSNEEENTVSRKSAQEKKTKTKPKKVMEKKNINSEEFIAERTLISPERKKSIARLLRENTLNNLKKNVCLTTTETRTIITDPSPKNQKIREELANAEQLNSKKERSTQKFLKESFSEEQKSITFESAGDVSRTISKTFTNKTYRASSVDSKTSYSKTTALKESGYNQSHLRIRNETSKKEEKSFWKTNCRSLTNISIRPKLDFTQRLQLESIYGRKKSNQNAYIKKLKESYTILKASPREATNETHKNLNEKEANQTLEYQKKLSKSQNTLTQYEAEFLCENPSQVNDESLERVHVQNEKEKNITLKQSSPRKNQFQEKGNEESLEILRLTDSEKSVTKDSSKGDARFLDSDSKNYQTSASCSTLKKISASRLHSAETLHSLKKNQKQKSKKRPYCSKRNSRQYIRKNYSAYKKHSRPFNFLSLTDEEQLKIISVNVAKYIKQKLMDEKTQLETEKNSAINVKKELRVLSAPEEKSEEKPKQKATALNLQKTKKLRIPVLKSIERPKEKEKDDKNIKKPNITESQVETVKQKPLYSSTRPVNNFIKLNKQMAGTYKRIPPTALKINELKEKEKLNLGTKPTTKISKPKAKTQKKTKDKVLAEKPKEGDNYKPQTPSSPSPAGVTQIPSPKGVARKEKQIKSPATYKKPGFNSRETNKAQVSSPKVDKPFKPNESVGGKYKQDPEKTFPPSANTKEITPAKKCVVPSFSKNFDSATPETTENFNENNTPNEVIKCDAKANPEEEIKNEAQFKRELEYFITMQMYLNNEISQGIENPLQYFNPKLLLSTNTEAENVLGNDSSHNLEFSDKDVVFVKKKNLDECLSSCSELNESSAKFIQEKDLTDEKNEENPKSKQILTVKAPKEFHDCTRINSTPAREVSEDSPSDSSYDCKISITLNTNPNAIKVETENERQSYETYCLEENSNSVTTMSLERNSSQMMDIKPGNKQEESEMSLEMKQKLLEILEGISGEISSGPSNDGFTFKAGDSDGNLRSQSTGSSSDNIEALAQLSSTMRQYLTYLKEIKRLPNESKDYEEF